MNPYNPGMTTPHNLTAVWNRCHAHLQPDPAALPLAPPEHCTCPLCDSPRAFAITAHVRYGEAHWDHDAHPLYCPDCRQYSLTAAPDMPPVTAVNARLWSASPTFLNIEPTTRCNFSCWYCVGRHMRQQDIRPEDFDAMLDHFPTVETIALVGEGEPLLHKDFFPMAHRAKDRGIRVVIISNGSAFSQSVIRKLCEAQIAYIGISIDSIDPATFARSRIDGDLNKVWKGIERLRAYRDRHGFRYPKIGLKGTLFSYSQDDLLSIVAEAKRHGVEIFESFQALNPMRTYVPIYPEEGQREIAHIDAVAQAIARDSAQAVTLLPPITDFCAEEGIPLNDNLPANGLRQHCNEKWLYSLLSGDVTPCCQIKTPIDPGWNLFHHSVEEILTHPRYENTRFNLWNGLFPQYCAGCWKTR